MQNEERQRLEELIAGNEELPNTFLDMISKDDLEKVEAGKRCKKWIVTPAGMIKCVLWAD